MEVPVPGGVMAGVVKRSCGHDDGDVVDDDGEDPQQQQRRAWVGLAADHTDSSTTNDAADDAEAEPEQLQQQWRRRPPLTPRLDNNSNSSNTNSKQSVDNSCSSNNSSAAAAGNYVHSFDDQGRAASYLQFFRRQPPQSQPATQQAVAAQQAAAARPSWFSSSKDGSNSHATAASCNTEGSGNRNQNNHSRRQFAFDVYSTDRTTRYPPPPPSAAAVGGGMVATAASLSVSASNSSGSSNTAATTTTTPGTARGRGAQQPLKTDTAAADSSSPATSTSSSDSSSGSSTSSSSSSMFLMSHGSGTALAQQQVLYDKHRPLIPSATPCRAPSPGSVPDGSATGKHASRRAFPSQGDDDTHGKLDRTSLESNNSTTAATSASHGSSSSHTTTTSSSSTPSTLAASTATPEAAKKECGAQQQSLPNQQLLKQPSLTSVATGSSTSATTATRSVTFHPRVATQVTVGGGTAADNHNTRKDGRRRNSPSSSPSTASPTSHRSDGDGSNNSHNLSLLSQSGHLHGLRHVVTVPVPHLMAPCPSSAVIHASSSPRSLSPAAVHGDEENPQQQPQPDAVEAAAAAPSLSGWWRDAWTRVRAECQERLPGGVAAAVAGAGGVVRRRRPCHLHHSLSRGHRHHPMPLSPRSRNLADLRYLTAQHRQKLRQMFWTDDDDGGAHHFDFVLVLQPQQVYGFWAELLDFRVELLGQDAVEALEGHWRSNITVANSANSSSSVVDGSSLKLRPPSQTESDTDEDDDAIESNTENGDGDGDVFVGTPNTGVRRRRNNSVEDVATPLLATPVPNNNHRGIYSSRRSLVSPGLYSCSATANDTLTTATSTVRKQSMFERAIATPHDDDDDCCVGEPAPHKAAVSATRAAGARTAASASKTAATTTTPATAYRRRWGNQQVQQQQQQQQQKMLMNSQSTPPVRSLAARQRSSHKGVASMPSANRLAAAADSENGNSHNSDDPNVLSIEDIPNQVIARGIAARTNRTNGMLPFLSALKRGIVLRRHRPNTEAVFCKLSSPDNGDTIVYQTVDAEEAILALREQRVRYNRDSNVEAQPWSLEVQQNGEIEFGTENAPHNFSVPDYVAADAYRKRRAKFGASQLGHRVVSELASKVASSSRTGSAKVADVVAVHPARNKDPRAESSGALGSTSLRRSQSEYSSNLTFSLVVRAKKGAGSNRHKDKMEELENKWHEGEGNEAQFRYLDWEAATEGEYWLVFRGLLLLHRDAAVGRFAKQRAAGIGTNIDAYSSSELLGDDNNAEHNRLHQDEFHEPVTAGWLEKMIVDCRDLDTTYMEGFVTKEGAVPPPSDYFLGFRSPGTAIWSRLRQAGLETRRVYSLDPNRVMIKIHCPYDRLMDVAEVLRIQLKTKDGSFAPFREDMIDVFDRLEDPLEGPLDDNPYHDFQFRSSIRQSIIDFIIGSRIRDSGAELDQTTDLGQMVQARVPLHMHGKLEAIYNAWFYFWKVENWDRGGRRLMHNDQLTVDYGAVKDDDNNDHDDDDPNKKYNPDLVPRCLTRFFVGCMNQPLDSIEQYFGEKVAFYFTWLQHTAFHLVFLSLAGLVVFICQLSTGNVDHPLRPFFAVVVMLWTFVVLINWKKRANFMAYRWGTMNYKEQETTRPQFKGNYTQDEITREWIVTYPKWKRWLKYCISFPLTLFFTGGTLILILWVHANRDAQLEKYFQEEPENFHFNFTLAAIGQRKQIVDMELTRDKLLDREFWIIMVGLPSMLGLCLPLLNFILMRLSVMLNDFENYRTESEYRTYLIIKVFSFRFICYFATLYYYAFASVGPEETAIENGILRVGTGVLVYTTVAQWWQNILHVCFPMLIRKIRMHHRQQHLTNELRNIELEEEDINRLSMNRIDDRLLERQARLINKRLLLEQAQDDTWLELMNPAHDSFPEYIQAVVQFTFVSCFSVVLPITPLIVLFNYLISMRLDAYKLCKGRRRPLAEKTGGIGVWEHVLHIVAVISVLTNCWLMGFTSSQFTWIGQKIGDLGLFALIVGWEHVMLLIKYVMSSSMSPLPKSVRDAMKREQYELDKQRNTLMQERRQQQFDDDDGMGSSMRFRKSCSPSGGSSMRFRKSCSPSGGSRMRSRKSCSPKQAGFRSKFDKAIAEEEEDDDDEEKKRSVAAAAEQV